MSISTIGGARVAATSRSVVTGTISGYTPVLNDVILIYVKCTTGGIAMTGAPSGWVNPLGGTTTVVTAGSTHVVIYHQVTSAEVTAGTVSFTATNLFGASTSYVAISVAIRGVDPVTPIDDINTTFSNTATTTNVIAGLTGSNLLANSLVIGCVASDNTSAYTDPSGWTLIAKNVNGSNNDAMYKSNTLTTAGVGVATQNITLGSSSAYGSIAIAFASADVTLVPASATVALTGSAPDVASSAATTVTPTGASLAAMGSAPVVSATNNITVTPTGAVIAVTGRAPSVTATANVVVAPGVSTLAAAGGVPAVGVAANVVATPGGSAVAVVGGTPVVTATANRVVTPGAAYVGVIGGMSILTTTLRPGAASVVIVGAPPRVTLSFIVSPVGAPVAVVGSAPVVTATANKVVTPGNAYLAISPGTPTVAAGGNIVVVPLSAAVVLSGGRPVVTATANKVVAPGSAYLTVTGGRPTITTTASISITPGVGIVVVTSYAPTITDTGNTNVRPGASVITLIGYRPTVTVATPPTYFVDYGFAQSELPWGTASPGPISRDVVTRICEGIKAVGGSRVRMGVQIGTLDDLDFAVNAATAAGLKPLLCVLGNKSLGYTGGAASYGSLCKMLALRYGPSGTNQVGEWELWNESNLSLLNGPKVAAAGYIEYLKSGYTAIHSVHSSAVVMAAGTIPGPTTLFGWEYNPLDWYTALYAAGAQDYMDAVAMHLYSSAKALPNLQMIEWQYILQVRDLMVAQGDSAKRIWITEVGTSNPGPGITTDVQERDWLKAMVDDILSFDWMGPFYLYDFENSGDLKTGNYGIVTHVDLIPKPLKYAYCQSISASAPNPVDRTPPSPPTSLSITTDGLATWQPATDDVGVTVYRIYESVTNVMLCHTAQVGQTSISIPDLTAGAAYVVYCTALDAAGNESLPSATAGFTTAAMPGAQQDNTADFSGYPTVPPDFAQVGWGFKVISGVALPNAPTTPFDGYTIAPSVAQLASADHYSQIQQDAASAYGDRYAMAGCRVAQDGSRGVFGFISGDGQVDAAQIVTIEAGVATIRNAENAAPLLPGEWCRITPSGSTYVLERISNGVATELTSWNDITGVYKGAASRGAGIAWRHKFVGGIYYPPNGITKWKAADTSPVTSAGGGTSDAWTLALVKPSRIGFVAATNLWEPSLR